MPTAYLPSLRTQNLAENLSNSGKLYSNVSLVINNIMLENKLISMLTPAKTN